MPRVPMYSKYFTKPVENGIQEIPFHLIGIFTNIVTSNRLIENDRMRRAIFTWDDIQRRWNGLR